MHLVRRPLTTAAPDSAVIPIRVERSTLAKRLWRGQADDGTEFGFELEAPLVHGDVVRMEGGRSYFIQQEPEPVLEIPLDLRPDVAALTGWAVGNLHFPVEAQRGRLLAPDDSALRQALGRMGLPWRAVSEVFRPHRMAANAAPHPHPGQQGHAPAPYRSVAGAASTHGRDH